MDQKRIKAISLFILFQSIVSLHGEVITPEEGTIVEIQCEPQNEKMTTVMWFRVVDNRVEYIGAFQRGTLRKEIQLDNKIYNDAKMSSNILKIRSFNPQRDSGVYSCAVVNSNVLTFGKVTILQRAQSVSVLVTPAIAGPATQTKRPISPTVCTCNIKTEEALSIWTCSPIVLGSLACGYGVIILLFVITIIYCNRIRTRRCPHHYKRQKQRRKVEGGHAMKN